MLYYLLLAWLVPSQAVPKVPIDARAIEVGTPVIVAEIDTGKLKGDVRRLSWSPDLATLYLQTAEGNPPAETLHHYSIGVSGGAVAALDKEPDWAASYWAVKQDRVAPGLPGLVIEVTQGTENIKNGPGAAGMLDRGASRDPGSGSNPSADGLARAAMGTDHASVVRLTLQGTEIATWTNDRPIPGTRFSWGPNLGGALVHVGDKGQLVFLDQQKQRQVVSKVKDAVLPAWSADGTRVAYLQKVGRKKYSVAWVPVAW
jgi:hypothetical protein